MNAFIQMRGRHYYGLLLFLFLGLILAARAPHPAGAGSAATAAGDWRTFALIDTAQASNDFTMQPVVSSAPNGNLIVAFNVYDSTPLTSPQKPYYSVSTDNGLTWSNPGLIHNTSLSMHNVQVIYDRNSIAHAVWTISDDSSQTFGIFYAPQSQWTANGNGFTEIPSQGLEILDPPAMAVGPDNTIHVVWAQADDQLVRHVFHAYLPPGGFWTVSDVLDNRDPQNRFLGGGAAPDVIVDASGNLHLAWEQTIYDDDTLEPYFEIHYLKGTPGGGGGYKYTWASNAQIVSGTLNKARRPILELSGNTLHIAFAQSADDVSEPQYAYYRRYPLTGSLGPLVRVNEQGVRVNSANPYFLDPAITVCKDDVYVYFHGATLLEATEQILGSTSANNWQRLDEVTEAETRHIFPSLVCHRERLGAVMERIEVPGLQHEVYFAVRGNTVYMPIIPKLSRR